MNVNDFDDEIAAAERHIALQRHAFDSALSDGINYVKQSARETVTSPLFLIGAAGVGFLLSKLFVTKAPPAPPATSSVAKKSLFGVIATAAFSIVQAQFGGPVGLARWIAVKILSRSRPRETDPAMGT